MYNCAKYYLKWNNMSQTLYSHFLDDEQNFIIIGVCEPQRTLKIYKKTPDDLFFQIIQPPLKPYLLYNTLDNKYNYLCATNQSFYLCDDINARDLLMQRRISTERFVNQNPQAQLPLEHLKKNKPVVRVGIPSGIELEAQIEPSIDAIVDAIPTTLPEEVKARLINLLKYQLGVLSNLSCQQKINALDGILSLNTDNSLANISCSVLNEAWLAYQLIDYPDVSIFECQNFILQIILGITKYHTHEPREVHCRTLSQRTAREFLIKDYPQELSDDQILERYNEQIKKIDTYPDFPSDTDIGALKDLLLTMISERNHTQQNSSEHSVNFDPLEEFKNKTTTILDYWKPIVYTDFKAYLWRICDLVLRLITYIDIFALQLSATAQLIAEFKKLSSEEQHTVCSELNIHDFQKHIHHTVLFS